MTEGRVIAAVICAVLIMLIVIAIVRWRMPSVSTVFALMFGIPAVGFGAYAFVGGPQPNSDAEFFLLFILYGAMALILAVAIVVRRIRRRVKPTVWSMASDSRRYTVALISRWAVVLWVSYFLFLFEPGFAIANIALNLAWMIAWLPRRFRTWTDLADTTIAAPPERVFEFVTDVRNWRRYRDDVELVKVTPDAPLAPGSEYVVRVAMPESLRRTSYRSVEFRYRVTAMEPGRSYETKVLDQSATIKTVIEATPSGTRLSRTGETTVGLLRAWAADRFNNDIARKALRIRDQRNSQRLKAILEAAPNQ